MAKPQPIADVMARTLERLRSGSALPNPMPPAMGSALRSLISTAECAALAGIEPEHFDAMVGIARRAYADKFPIAVTEGV